MQPRPAPVRRGLFRQLGPGILFAATSVGASHVLMSPEAGARFEYALVWLVVAVHLLKYPAFEAAPRWVAATGTSLLEAWAAAPGPRGWALKVGLADLTVQAIGLVAALVGLTAAFAVAALGYPASPGRIAAAGLALTAVLLALVRWGRYRALRAVNLVLLLALTAGTAVAFVAAPPPASALAAAFRPRLPDGSIVLVAAILGFMPTSIAVSLWQSLWALEQGRFRDAPRNVADRLALLRAGLFDLRLGYGLSAALAVVFVALGATVLHPRGLLPRGNEVALVLSELYAASIGPWMRPVFLGVAFAALFTTCHTMMDGFPRSFVAARRVLAGGSAVAPAGQDDAASPAFWTFLAAVTFGGMALLALAPDPAALVKGVGAVGLLTSPFYFGLNLWAVTRRVDDPRLRPGGAFVALAVAGIALMTGAAGLLLWTTFVPGASA